MNREWLGDYPDCMKLFHHLKTSLRSQPKVLKAYLWACTAEIQRGDPRDTAKIAQDALQWGAPPRIVPVAYPIRPPVEGKFVNACGFHNHLLKGTNQVEIIDVWFDAYETCPDEDRVRNAHRLTTTLLHETIHWVREQANARDEITDSFGKLDFAAEEAGEAFEQLAFGARVCTEAEVEAAKHTRRPNI